MIRDDKRRKRTKAENDKKKQKNECENEKGLFFFVPLSLPS